MDKAKKSGYKGFTKAQARAHRKYMEKYVEVKVRMTPDERTILQTHAEQQSESVTAFINRAIRTQMELDRQK